MADLTGVTWRKSSRSQGANNCVEVGLTRTAIGVRDTKNRNGSPLVFTPEQWQTFTSTLKATRP